MKKYIFLMAVFILFLPSFLFGFAFRYAESAKIKETEQKEFVKLEEFIEDYPHEEKNDIKDHSDTNGNNYNDSIDEKKDVNPLKLVDESTLNSIKKAMKDPEVIDTLVSVAGDLDNVQFDLENNNEKEMVLLVQKSLQEYMSEEESYKETISEALVVYNKLNAEQKNRIMMSIMSNVSWGEMLFLKRTFGL